MTRDQMQQFARFGAEARLQAISEERDAILQAFPDLGRASTQANGSLDGAAPARRASAPARKRRGISVAQRKAVGDRMKAYWAKRRGETAGEAAPPAETASEVPVAQKPAAKRKSGMSADGRKAQAEKMRAYWAARRAEKGPASNGGQADTGAGSSGKSKGSRTAGRREARKK